MRAFGQVDLTTVSLPEELVFVATRRGGWTDYFTIPLLAGLVVWLWIARKELMSLLAAFIGGFSLLASWSRGPETRLKITSTFLLADGNLDRMMTNEIRIPASEVKWINWASGGEDGLDGLHVGRGWTSVCVLPSITEQQARTIRSAIEKKFPEISIDDPNPASFLFGNGSGITELGISRPNPVEPESDKQSR
jgi:hypothetical protein